jgi:hypothetical protein
MLQFRKKYTEKAFLFLKGSLRYFVIPPVVSEFHSPFCPRMSHASQTQPSLDYLHLYAMQLPPGIRIKESSFAAKIAAWKLGSDNVALVLGKTIHLYNVSKQDFLSDTRWVRHELEHIEQFRQYGFIRFLVLYFIEWIKRGYFNNRFEIEARMAENNDNDKIIQF